MSGLTKKAILDSFLKLISERPLNKITVSDIVKNCGITRRTFYYYFHDIYSVVDEVFNREIQYFIDNYGNYKTWQDGFIEASRFVLDNKKAIYHIYNSVSREVLESYLNKIAYQNMYSFINKISMGIAVKDEDKKVIADFYRFALVGMSVNWIQTGMKEPPEAYIKRVGDIFEGSIMTSLKRCTTFVNK